MLVVEHASVEVDACPACEGTWFDAGEIDLLLERGGIGAAERDFERLLTAAEGHGERPRRCPLCARKMRKVRVGADGPVLDACPRGEGLWLDRGELAGSLKASGLPDAAHRILNYLHDLFPAPAGNA